MNQEISSGDICWVDMPKTAGSCQFGIRPAIIISNKMCLKNSPTLQVVLCTSKSKNQLPVHMELPKFSFGLNQKTTVLAESITTISRNVIQHKIGSLDENTFDKVKNLVLLQLGI